MDRPLGARTFLAPRLTLAPHKCDYRFIKRRARRHGYQTIKILMSQLRPMAAGITTHKPKKMGGLMKCRLKFDRFVISVILIYGTIFLILLYFAFEAKSESITLEWEYGEQDPEGFRVYQTIPEQNAAGDWQAVYDYINPVTTALYQDGNIPGSMREVTIELPGRQGQVTKYLFVARAYRGGVESADSNEVAYKVVLIPPAAPQGLTGVYDAQGQSITLQWQQGQDGYGISHWIIYRRLSGDFIPLGTVSGGQALTLTADVSALAPAGVSTDIDFTVTAYRSSGVFSANSNVVTVTVDRRELQAPQGLQIKVDIPL